MFTSIRHIAVMTENWDREAKFYQTIFGMKKITNGMTDEKGDYNKDRGHLSDGVIGLALLQRQPGSRSGLDHFGFAVENVQTGARAPQSSHTPISTFAESPGHVPFAGLRGHDPDGNQYDLSQKGMANVREGYVEFGWEQPRWINHVCIRSGRPAYIAEFYQKVFDLQPVEGMSGDNSYYLTDGKVNLAIRPWDMVQYRGHMAGLDHFGFKVDDLEQTKKDLDALAAASPASAPRKIAIGREGETRQKNLEGCKLCKQSSRRSRRRAAGSDGLSELVGSAQLIRRLDRTRKAQQSFEGFMEFANINDTMRTAKEQDKRFMPLFGSETFRSWILYFRPGEHTDMHFHMSPETFLVLQGKASVKGLKGEERIIEKNEIVFFGAKDYYQITNVGTEPLVLVGNRSEAFGGAHVTAKEA